jgi:hypothetical protein
MNKTAVALLGGSLVVALGAGLLLSVRPNRPAADGKDGPPSSPVGRVGPAGGPASETDEARISRLALERSPGARLELVALYAAWAQRPDRATQRRILIDKVVGLENPRAAIELLTMAVARDPVPLERDELLPEAARAIAPLWKDQKQFAEGRDMLRLMEDDKSRALLAASLTERIEHTPAGLPIIGAGERQELASDLIQVNMHSANPALKQQTLGQVRAIAGDEVAEVLADPANAQNSLAARRAEQAQREASETLRRHRGP